MNATLVPAIGTDNDTPSLVRRCWTPLSVVKELLRSQL